MLLRTPHFNNQRGMSLLEVVIALGSASMLLLVLSELLSQSASFHQVQSERGVSQENLFRSRLNITNSFRLAVDMGVNGAISAAIDMNAYDPSGSTRGLIRAFDSTNPAARDIETIAVFLRESSSGSATASLPVPTGVYFRAPTAAESGRLIFNLGETIPLEPNTAQTVFDSLVEFQVTPDPPRVVETTPGVFQDYATSATFRLVTRHFPTPDSPRIWCPRVEIEAAAPGCAHPALRYIDSEIRFRVSFTNNIVGRGPASDNPVTDLYFFRPSMAQ